MIVEAEALVVMLIGWDYKFLFSFDKEHLQKFITSSKFEWLDQLTQDPIYLICCSAWDILLYFLGYYSDSCS